MILTGAAIGLGNLLAGKAIGEFIWRLRGYPFDIGPELLFWARRGLVVAGLLCLLGGALILIARAQRRSG